MLFFPNVHCAMQHTWRKLLERAKCGFSLKCAVSMLFAITLKREGCNGKRQYFFACKFNVKLIICIGGAAVLF